MIIFHFSDIVNFKICNPQTFLKIEKAKIIGINRQIKINTHKLISIQSSKIPIFRSIILKNLKSIKSALLNTKIDIICVHTPIKIGNLGLKISKKNAIPTVGFYSINYYKILMKYFKNKIIVSIIFWFIKRFYSKVDYIICENLETYNLLSKFHKKVVQITPKPLFPHENIYDEVIRARLTYNLYEENNILLYVGGLNYHNNPRLILDSLFNLQRHDISFKMVMVGSGNDEKHIKKMIGQHHLNDKIIILEKVNYTTLASLYSICDLFLYPDDTSLTQINIFQAAYFKKPSLVLKTTINSNIIDWENGFVAEKSEYSKKLVEIILNKDLMRFVGLKSYEDFINNGHNYQKELVKFFKTIKK